MTPPYQDPRLQFLWLLVQNLRSSVDFYRDVLGFPVQDEVGNFAVVHLANSQLYLAPGQPAGEGLQIAIAVPDVDALQQRLSAHQINLSAPVDAGWARYLELNDPDGYHLILLQPHTDTPSPNP